MNEVWTMAFTVLGSLWLIWLAVSVASFIMALIMKKNFFIRQTMFARTVFGIVMNSVVTVALFIVAVYFFTDNSLGLGVLFLVLALTSAAWRVVGGVLTMMFSGVSMILGTIVARRLNEASLLDQIEMIDIENQRRTL